MDASTPKDAKIRVDKATATLTKTRCLVTNVDCDTMVDYAHVLACAIGNNEHKMDKLEFSWDMGWRTQNIHTRRNIFRLSAKFHRLFDANKWLLLPETSIIDHYERALRSNIFPEIKKKAYKYTLVAHPDMKKVPIHRWDEKLAASPSAFKKFVYPFEDFPDLVSHVHPRFVICDAGRKLRDIDEVFAFAKGKDHGELYENLVKAARIYRAWQEATPGNQFYEDEPKPQSRPVKTDRKCKGDASYTESSGSSTPPITRIRSRPSCSAIDGTPSERVLDDYPISGHAKTRVDKVAATRCLIENTDESNALDYAHLLPRSTKDVILTGLEYSWGMPYKSLNVDTRHNIFRLSRNFHRLFDGMAWLLLPETHIIKQYHKMKDDPQNFPVFDSKTYRYTLMVNDLMEHVPIHMQRDKPSASEDGGEGAEKEDMYNDEEVIERQESSSESSEGSSDDNEFNFDDAFAAHTYPFRSFPPIISHVHPRFVICNAGAKLDISDVIAQFIATNRGAKKELMKVLHTYRAWKKPRKPSDFPQKEVLHQDEPADDFSDNQTEARRLHVPRAKRTRFTPGEGDGSPKSGKRARSGGDKDSAWLDDATLGELDPEQSPKKAWQDKVEWIQTWVGQVPQDAMEEIPTEIDVEDKSVCRTPDQVGLDWEEINSALSA